MGFRGLGLGVGDFDVVVGFTGSELLIDNLLVRIHFIVEMLWWTGLARWEFEFSSPSSLASTFLVG